MMPHSDAPSVSFPKLLTPIGGMIVSIFIGGTLWGGLLIGMHAAGMF